MNVLYLHTHDSGRMLQPYGCAVSMPRLMQLAESGTVFRHCYNAGPTCSPSRSALLTGMSPHSCGMLGLAHRGWQLNDYRQHLAQYLGHNGYDTVLCGVQHEAREAQMIGYDRLIGSRDLHGSATHDSEASWDLANAACVAEFIKDQAGQSGKPFFLSFGLFNTHREFPQGGEPVNPDYLMPPFPLYDCHQNRSDLAAYFRSAQVVDRCVGQVLDALRESGLDQETLVIFTTDHGIAFPHMKCNLYDTGIGVALILSFPGNPSAGKATDALVSHIDLFPTLCELLQIKQPEWLQGISLMPILTGQSEEVRTEVFSEVTYHAAYEPMRCIRTSRYKLIRFYDDHNEWVPANMDDSPSKSFLIEHDFLSGCREREMLFDLYLDPVERENLVSSPRYRGIYHTLSARLERWMKETGDPLLTSGARVPPVSGARTNRRTSLSPRADDFETDL